MGPEGDESITDMVTSLYLSAVISAGYQLMPEDANDFGNRVAKLVGGTLNVEANAELAPELEIADEPEDTEEEEEEEEEASTDKDEVWTPSGVIVDHVREDARVRVLERCCQGGVEQQTMT